MKHLYLLILLVFFFTRGYAQAPRNDEYTDAITIQALNNCSDNAAYTTVSATNSLNAADGWNNANGPDVWFKFTALRSDVNINVYGGNVNGTGTLTNPLIALYSHIGPDPADQTRIIYDQAIGSFTRGTDVSTYYKGGLTPGQTYYIRVAGSNTGTFKLCINNYSPPLKAGQDCSSASLLCGKQPFTQTDVTGAGTNAREAVGTCLDANSNGGSIEANTAWYRWEAANNGTLTFTITPTSETDDIDWVLYDMGTSFDCAKINGSTAIRCASGSGVDCPVGSGRYFKTGLSLNSSDLNERAGCATGQDGFVRFINMVQGHHYALLVNNFSSGNNGFKMEFGGTGEFVGPKADFSYAITNPCLPEQTYTFTNKSSGYAQLKWTFGEGALPTTATGEGPFTVTYSSTGTKTVVLEAASEKGCVEVKSETFIVGVKPDRPQVSITNNRTTFCLNETLELSANPIKDATYTWTGPNGYTATGQTISIPLTRYDQAGTYTVVATVGPCASDPASVTIPAIGQTPVVDFTITGNNVCDPAERSYTINSTARDYQAISWDFDNGATIQTAQTSGPFTLNYTSSGTKTIRVTAVGSSGCTVIVQKTIEVPAKPETPLLTKNKAQYCIGDQIILSTTAQPNTTYAWTGPNNFTASTASVTIPATNVNLSGDYRLVVTQGQCSSDVALINVPTIIPMPKPDFTSTPNMPAKLNAPVTVKFQNQSADADTYLWDFGDGSTSTEANPEHTYSERGDFTVKLTATKQGFCVASTLKGTLVVRFGLTTFVPNTFTPNADGVNDELVVTVTNLNNYHINIYNRYGTKLFESRDIFENWKGTYRNEPVPVGVYFYVIDGVGLDGEKVQKTGSVTVLR